MAFLIYMLEEIIYNEEQFAQLVDTTVANLKKFSSRYIKKMDKLGISVNRKKVSKGIYEYHLEYKVEVVTEDDLYIKPTERLKKYMIDNFGTRANVKYEIVGYLLATYMHEQYIDTDSIPMTQKEITNFINTMTDSYTTSKSIYNYNSLLRAIDIIKFIPVSERKYTYYVTARYKKGECDTEYYKDTCFKSGNKVTYDDYVFIYRGATNLIRAKRNKENTGCEWEKEVFELSDKDIFNEVAKLLDPNAIELRINKVERKTLKMDNELFAIVNEFYEDMYGIEMDKKIALAS